MNKEDVETLYQGMRNIANSITPMTASVSIDAAGAYVSSLTEAVMGNTKALIRVADALDNIADALRESGR